MKDQFKGNRPLRISGYMIYKISYIIHSVFTGYPKPTAPEVGFKFPSPLFTDPENVGIM